MVKCSKIFYGLSNHLDVGESTVTVWMGEKERLYLFYVKHHDFGGVISFHRDIESRDCVFFFLGTWHSEVALETSKYL